MGEMGSIKPMETQLSIDAEAWLPNNHCSPTGSGPTTNFTSSDISVDAVPGRRHQVPQGGFRPPIRPAPPENRQPTDPPAMREIMVTAHALRQDARQVSAPASEDRAPSETRPSYADSRQSHFPPVQQPKSYSKQSSEDEVLKQVRDKVQSLELSCSNDSSYGSFSSDESSRLTLTPTISLEEEIEDYKPKMPTDMKAPYIDVLILYAEDDRKEAEAFRQHLVKDIILPDKSHIKALLYDCAEFTGLSGSSFQHLELAVERSTYVFVYLTKQFVECKWCEISSESCLMKAIYDSEKRWCVVPVYTQRRNKCNFKIPMGLNSLKGINYYNNDEFYKNGVARLIGDKADVKVRMTEALKEKQKTWIEKYKRDQERQKDEQLRIKHIEEEKTRALQLQLEEKRKIWEAESNFRMSFSENDLYSHMHHSASTNSLKDVTQYPPGVAQYFHDLKQMNLNQAQHQYGAPPPHYQSGPPPPYTSAGYGQHGVKRSTSQMSSVSHDNVSIPPDIYNKIKDFPPEEQKKYVSFYLQQASLQHQQEAVMNMPQQSVPSMQAMSPPMGYIQQQQYQQLLLQHQHQQQQSFQGYHGSHQTPQPPPVNNPNLHNQTDPLQSAPNLNMNSLKFPEDQGNVAGPQMSQVPNFDDLSVNSYHSEPGASSAGGNNSGAYSSSSSSEQSSSALTGSEGQGQSVDGPPSSHQAGNIPDLSLMQSSLHSKSTDPLSADGSSPLNSLEQDSASFCPLTKTQGSVKQDDQDTLESSLEGKSEASSNMKKVVKKSKGEKHVHYTIYNIYEANTVQIGESNKVVNPGSDGDSDSQSEDEGDMDDDVAQKQSNKTTEKSVEKTAIKSEPTNPKPVHGSTFPSQMPGEVCEPVTADAPKSSFLGNNLNSVRVAKSSDGGKQIGMVSPIIQSSRDTSPVKGSKDETELKSVMPTSQTMLKTVAGADIQPQIIMPMSVQNCTNNESTSNVSAVVPRQQNPVRPMQSNQPFFCSSNFSNPANFYQPRLEPVRRGDDPLQNEAVGRDLPGESNGFNPNTNHDDGIDEDYDLLEHDNYEGGVLTESVEDVQRQSTSKGFSFLQRFVKRVK